MLNTTYSNSTLYISNVLGLDVFSTSPDNNSIFSTIQVAFSNNNNRVTVAVRRGSFSLTTNTVNWSTWQMLRSSFNINMINDYLETHRNLVESLYDATRKQSFLVSLTYRKVADDLVVVVPAPEHNIFRQISGLFIVSQPKTDNQVLISDNIPIILHHTNASVPPSFQVRYNKYKFDVSINNNSEIVIKNFYKELNPLRVLAIA